MAEMKIARKRKRGRPKRRWTDIDTITADVKHWNLKAEDTDDR